MNRWTLWCGEESHRYLLIWNGIASYSGIRYWVDRGALVQITGQSILGHFGATAARVCRGLLDAGLVHFVAVGRRCSRTLLIR